MEAARELTILANPGHGNGPIVSLLMAAETFQRVAGLRVNLIVPAFGGDAQRAVLTTRRDPGRDVHVFFAPTLGRLLAKVTLRNHDFRQNIVDIATCQKQVQAQAQSLVAEGFADLRELLADGRDSEAARSFSRREMTLELNHGSRVRLLPSERAFYFFPCLLSDLLARADLTDRLEPSLLETARVQIAALEQEYACLFLPAIHTFSWDETWQRPRNCLLTPFPRPVPRHSAAPPKGPGVYLMPSGVGSKGDAEVVQAVKAILALRPGNELATYYPASSQPPQAFLDAFSKACPLTPAAIPHEDIRLVVGRAGWGTLWECMNARKIFVAIPPIPGDDTEIEYNLRSLQRTGLGLVWNHRHPSNPWQNHAPLLDAIDQTLASFRSQFQTIDGLEVMAREILARTTSTV